MKDAGPLLKRENDLLSGRLPLVWIGIAVFIAYFPTLSFGFSPMDEVWVFLKHMDRFTHLSNLPSLFFEPAVNDYYRPVWTSSCMIDASLGNGAPWVFHLTNILVHLAASLLLYLLFIELRVKKQTAFFLALIFAVHPLNVHAVAWIPGRNDSLLAVFVFAAFLSALKYFNARKKVWAVMGGVFLTLSLFTKETAIVVPGLLLLFIFHFVPAERKKEFLLLFLSWCGITFIWFFIRHSIVATYPGVTASNFMDVLPDMFEGLLMQVGKFLFPVKQSVMPTVTDTPVFIYVPAVLLFLLLIFRSGFKNRKLALFGLEWFVLLVIIPLVFGSLNGNHEHYEHRMYVPSLGLLLFASQLDIQKVKIFSGRNARVLAGMVFFSLLLVNTFARCRVYKDAFTYAKAGISEAPHKAFFYNSMGEHYAKENDFDNALSYFNKSIELYPNKGLVYCNRGYVYLRLHKNDLAIADFNSALRIEPGRPDFLMARAKTWFFMNNIDSAEKDLQRVKAAGGEVDTVFVSKFYKAWNLRKGNEEVEKYTAALKTDTATAYSYNFRGMAFCKLKRYREALSDFNTAVKMRSDQLDFLFNRAVAYQYLDRPDSAYADFKFCYDKGYAIDKNELGKLKEQVDARKK
ncbi:MAG TPA: tetratricopeptide repeat protein [Bacteroidia bacterium]